MDLHMFVWFGPEPPEWAVTGYYVVAGMVVLLFALRMLWRRP